MKNQNSVSQITSQKNNILNELEVLPSFLKNSLIIDAHAHLLYPSGTTTRFLGTTPAEMVQEMDKYQIDKACISIIGVGDRNYEVTNAIDEFPDRFIGMHLINPRYSKNMRKDLEKSFEHPGMQAIGEVHPTSYQHEYPVTGRDYWPAWEFAEEKRLTVLIHSGPMSEYDRCAPSEIAKVAKQHPNMNVLIGHTGGYSEWDLLEEAIGVVLESENTYLEICAMGRHFGALEYMVSKVGAERVVFGTDAPFHDWHAEIANVAFSRIPESDKKLIFGQNMQRLLDKTIK